MVRITGQKKDNKELPASGEAYEALLMQRIASKDREAFESLYYDYTPRIGSFMMKLLKSPELVDEAINEVMMTVWQSAERFDPALGKLSTWLFGIAHNKALKLLERQRRHWREQTVEAEDSELNENEWEEVNAESATVDPDNPERTVLGWELGEILVWAMDRLSPEHRIVLELVFTENYAYQDIAIITDCPVNTVKTRMFHARKKLADLLAKRGYSPYDLQEGHS
ncbi:RNA polymerase, sigma-24 subunit, ECF subfamily [Crenothrix polyspora]|uniref:RNA polymerase, sigma-24 subunit, ECF subfamily n=1 Tax=Crenothrix polyspora TaxID=360316 RepID=A0A1R4H9L3_9GAMM|nr:sigma-70 family RNA polymerase sigma factor [Crenothrix polyspora]SJM92857.1 RNA polymerase, sigma-24 subunit, ECF subfamily [Crenothrix polyspora]